MKTSLMKIAALCCVIILMAAVQKISNDEVKNKERDDYDSRDHALVALDVDVSDEDETSPDESFLVEGAEIFKPTREWQAVKPGQAVPSGLHIRLNLQTGEREAKLIDDDNSDIHGHYYLMDSKGEEGGKSNRHKLLKDELEKAMKELDLEQNKDDGKDGMVYWKKKNREGMVNLKKPSFTHGELKEALKKFKSERDDVQDPSVAAESSKTPFRTISEIREDFHKLNLDMKTDLEILKDIMRMYKNNKLSNAEHLGLLSELEYYVHQIDNAQNFADMDGILYLMRDLNSTSEEVRKEAALVLASAVQSNPGVQVTAIESGAMQKLIRMLSTEASVGVRVRVLTALSSVVRHFPFAQLKFLELGGLDSLTSLLRQPEISEKLCIKAVTLVNDLLVEQFSTKGDEHVASTLLQEKLNQYNRVPLLESVVEQGWCRLVPKLLDLSDHDYKEKVLSAMWTLKDQCRTDFVQVLPKLVVLKQEYTELSQREMEDDGVDARDSYFSSVLLDSIDHLVNYVTRARDEL